jgi:ABC-type nitrate/sulfonate/bicarbonate transport system substrate-binding protein
MKGLIQGPYGVFQFWESGAGMMRIPSKWALAAGALAAVLAGVSSSYAQQTIRVGWTIPAEESKYWMMKRPAEFPDLGKTYNIEWTQFQGTAPMTQALAAGALDCATQAPLSLANGVVGGGLKAYIVAQHVFEKPGGFSVYWAVKDDSPIKTIADLKDKTIGISVIGGGTQGPLNMLLKQAGLDPAKDIKLVEVGFAVSEDALRQGRVDAVNMNQPFAARAEAKGGTRKLFSLNQAMPNIVHILEACRADFVDKNPELAKMYVRDITSGMKKALANREETLKVVSEVIKAPIPVLDTYLLKDNDFGRDPGAAPNFAAIQKMYDIYTDAGMLPKMDVAQFKHPTIVAPIQ